MHCKLCNSNVELAFSEVFLNRYYASLLFCDNCGYLSVSDPHWLSEAYLNPIGSIDTGLLSRNTDISTKIASLLFIVLGDTGKKRYVDIAGGYGLLTRTMRDLGFDFYWSDKYAENLVAKGFEAAEADIFDGATAIEVAEHLVEPISFFEDALRLGGGLVIFTTLTFEGMPPSVDWWYYSFEGGQHISFYRKSTLECIAASIGARFYTSHGLHMFATRAISEFALSLFTSSRASRAILPIIKRLMHTKTQTDFVYMKDRARMVKRTGEESSVSDEAIS
jgi:hypothetical protein